MTDPTSDDVAKLCHAVALDRTKRWGYDETLDEAEFWDLVKRRAQEAALIRDVEVVLAALDLPGRERALREEIERLTTQLANTTAAFNEQVGWHNQASARVSELTAERNAAKTALANVTSALDDLKLANEALHVARDNTAALLEKSRAERGWLFANVNALIDNHGGCDSECTLVTELGNLLDEARQHAGGEGGTS